MENKEKENVTKSTSTEHSLLNTKIILTNDNTLFVSGVSKVVSSTQNEISLILNGQTLDIEGKNLTTTKLDTQNGILEASGDFVSMKFAGHKQKENIFKRIFG